MRQATKKHLRQCCEPVNYKTVSTIFFSTTAQTQYCLDLDDDEPQLISSTRKTVFLKKAKTATAHQFVASGSPTTPGKTNSFQDKMECKKVHVFIEIAQGTVRYSDYHEVLIPV